MSSHLTRERLERYHDGDLGPAERREAELHLSDCDACRSALGRLSRLGDLVQLWHAETVQEVDFSRFADSIDRKLAATPPLSLREHLVVEASERFRNRRALVLPLAAAAAVALALAAVLRFAPEDGAAPAPLVAQAPPPAPTGLPAPPPDAAIWSAAGGEAPIPGSEIAAVAFGRAAGMVFNVPDGAGGAAGVVWVYENP